MQGRRWAPDAGEEVGPGCRGGGGPRDAGEEVGPVLGQLLTGDHLLHLYHKGLEPKARILSPGWGWGPWRQTRVPLATSPRTPQSRAGRGTCSL